MLSYIVGARHKVPDWAINLWYNLSQLCLKVFYIIYTYYLSGIYADRLVLYNILLIVIVHVYIYFA